MRGTAEVGEMRVLTDAEIALVAGGPNWMETRISQHVGTSRINQSPDGAWFTSNGYVFFDWDHNGWADVMWRHGPTGWESTADGDTWTPDDNPEILIEEYILNHPQWNEVGGG